MTRILFVLCFFMIIVCTHSAVLRSKDSRLHSTDIRKACKGRWAERFFEWEKCSSKIRGFQVGKMEHFELKNGKCISVITHIKRPCPQKYPESKVFAQICKKKMVARRVKIISFKKFKRKVSYKVEPCAKYIPWYPCPSHEKMEEGECKPSKGGKGLRRIKVKVYLRKSLKHPDCRSIMKDTIEKCDYKKEKKAATGKSSKKKGSKKP